MKRITSIIATSALTASLSGCHFNSNVQDGPPRTYKNISQISQPKPHYLPKSRYGNPKFYTVNGIRYHVLPTAIGYNQRGIASWYGSKFTNKLTSTRELYDPYKMTAASPTLPIPCFVRVTNLENKRSIIVKVNDRGPFAPNRIIDLSYAAAIKLGYERRGTALVQVTAIDANRPNHWLPVTVKGRPQLYLQVGAFRDYAYALRLKNRIKPLLNEPIHLSSVDAHQQLWYRVQIGPLRGVGESDRLQQLLDQKGFGRAVTIIR